MAAPRSTSIRALRSLAQQHSPASASSFRRSLHITGAFSAQPATGTDVTSAYLARSLADLRTECTRRNLGSTGNKAELVDRLANHDYLQSRAFSIAMRRIDGQAFSPSRPRQFNTSRANKTVNDSSPVDFVYVPQYLDVDQPSPAGVVPRMPSPPDAYTHYEPSTSSRTRTSGADEDAETGAMKPQIYSVSDLSGAEGPSAMSDVVDNQALEINPFDLAETVNRSRSAASTRDAARSASGESVSGTLRELWSGMVDDVLGPKTREPSSRGV